MILLVLLLLLAMLFVLGPARPFIFGNVRFFGPAAVGAIGGFLLGLIATAIAMPAVPCAPVLPILGAAMGFFALGREGKDWFDRTFGPRR